ncbi:hypothetical protein QUC31_014430 [Theobroma cacao]
MSFFKSVAANSSAFTPREATIAMMQSSPCRVLSRRTCSTLRINTSVNLLYFRGSSSVKVFSFLNIAHYSIYSGEEFCSSSKRRSRGPVMAAKKASQGQKEEEGRYKHTVDLPKTTFGMRANALAREPEIQKLWDDHQVFKRVVDKNDGGNFVLHDGPPYANGDLHMGHALNKILKDIINRYKLLQNYKVHFVPGWDCHGLPIELKGKYHSDCWFFLQSLDQDARKDLAPLKLRAKAAKFAKATVKTQMSSFQRFGVWADWNNPYLTLDPEYEAAQIEVFGEMALKGYIYRGRKPVHWSPSTRTALAEAELEIFEKRKNVRAEGWSLGDFGVLEGHRLCLCILEVKGSLNFGLDLINDEIFRRIYLQNGTNVKPPLVLRIDKDENAEGEDAGIEVPSRPNLAVIAMLLIFSFYFHMQFPEGHVSRSIYALFRMVSSPSTKDGLFEEFFPDLCLAIWTTTPWTIPANAAVAVNAKLQYAVVEAKSFLEDVSISAGNKKRRLGNVLKEPKIPFFIVAYDLVPTLEAKWGIKLIIKKIFLGSDLENWRYVHPINNRECPVVIGGDYITTDSGTGLVHTAPGHGQEDYVIGLKYGLPIYSPVDDDGKFTEEAGEFSGLEVLGDGNIAVVKYLDEKMSILMEESYEHKYPYDWRSKKPTIFRATEQWFASVEGFRQAAMDAIGHVKWIPEQAENRISAMTSSRSDWCISRQRTWGLPIPVFYHVTSKEPLMNKETIDHIKSIIAQKGSDVWWYMKVEDLLPDKYRNKASEYEKGTDTMDVWFDSGTGSISRLICEASRFFYFPSILFWGVHGKGGCGCLWAAGMKSIGIESAQLSQILMFVSFPYMPGSSWAAVLGKRGSLSFPADLYLEGTDQHRGWFQSSLLTSIATKGRAPYSSVITHGFVLDEKGFKMSKSLGNVMDPRTVIEGGQNHKDAPGYGADILRLWVSSVDYTGDVMIGPQILCQMSDIYRKLRGTLRYLLGNLHDWKVESAVSYHELPMIDQHALFQLGNVVKNIREGYENYQFFKIFQIIQRFVIVDLSNFYFDVAKDRLYVGGIASFTRRSCQTVLAAHLLSLARVIAPILPHLAEDVWQNLPFKYTLKDGSIAEFVFESKWPALNEKWLTLPAEEIDFWGKVLELRTEVNKVLEVARTGKLIGSSLEAKVYLHTSDATLASTLLEMCSANNDADTLHRIFLTSQVEVVASLGNELQNIPYTGEYLVQEDKVWIGVSRAEGSKCERCWNYSTQVGSFMEHPTLCGRCFSVVGIQPTPEMAAVT